MPKAGSVRKGEREKAARGPGKKQEKRQAAKHAWWNMRYAMTTAGAFDTPVMQCTRICARSEAREIKIPRCAQKGDKKCAQRKRPAGFMVSQPHTLVSSRRAASMKSRPSARPTGFIGAT